MRGLALGFGCGLLDLSRNGGPSGSATEDEEVMLVTALAIRTCACLKRGALDDNHGPQLYPTCQRVVVAALVQLPL